jgi:hypothetical protein
MIRGGETMPWYWKLLPITWAAQALVPSLRRLKEGSDKTLYDDLFDAAFRKPVEVTGEAVVKHELEIKGPPGWPTQTVTYGTRVPLRGTTGEVGQGLPEVQLGGF